MEIESAGMCLRTGKNVKPKSKVQTEEGPQGSHSLMWAKYRETACVGE